MEITVNGGKLNYCGPLSVIGLLQSLGIAPQSVAVELNYRIVERAGWENEPLHEGDTIEVIRLVGGG